MYSPVYNQMQNTRRYPGYRGTGHGCVAVPKYGNRARTRHTLFGKTTGLPAPVENPKHI
jgi:hypothetical protein